MECIMKESWDYIADNIIYIVESNGNNYDVAVEELRGYLESEGLIEVIKEDEDEKGRLAEELKGIWSMIPGDYDLEMDHFTTYDDTNNIDEEYTGWYAYMYTGTESIPVNGDYQLWPVITDKQIKENNIDIYKVFDHIGCAYCG